MRKYIVNFLIGIFFSVLLGQFISPSTAHAQVCDWYCYNVDGNPKGQCLPKSYVQGPGAGGAGIQCVEDPDSCAYCGGGGGYGYEYEYQYQYQYQYQYEYEYQYQYQYEYQYEYEIEPDFDITAIDTIDVNGNSPSYFKSGQNVYVSLTLANIGDAYPCCTSRVAFYKDAVNPVSTGATSTIPMYLDISTNWWPGRSVNFQSDSDGPNRSSFASNYSFSQTNAGTYYLRAFADYNNQVNEYSSGNNQGRATYVVRSDIYGYACWSKDEDATCDAGEPKVSGVNINLDKDGDGNGSYETDLGTKTTVDDPSDKDYNFTNYTAGDYRLTFSSNSWLPVSSNPRYTTLGPDRAIHFAIKPSYDIHGYIFTDDNRDATKQATEAGYQGATVTLTGPNGTDTYTTDATGHYSFPNVARGTYTVTLTVPSGYKAYPNFDNTRTITIPLNSTTNTWREDIGINTVYTVSGRVFVDADKSGGYSATNDKPVVNQTVSVSGQNSGNDATDANGNFSIPNLEPGNYNLTTTPGSDYISLTTLPRTLTIAAANVGGQNIREFGKYTIAGNVFSDDDDSLTKNGSETNYAANPGITGSNYPSGAPNPIITNNNDGSYLIEGLISGQYTVRYPNLPTGYVMNHPRNGPPPSFVANVGSSCAEASPSPGGSCSAGNVQNLNFAIKSGQPWFQALGLDVRFDSGIKNSIPPAPDAACTGAYGMLPASSTTPGVVFTGNVPANFWQGQAAASPNNWVAGGSSYSEVFTPDNGSTITTAYAYMQSVVKQSNITTTNLSTVCTLSNCTLPANLASGVYVATSNVNLNAFTAAANRDIILLINGDLTIQGTLRVPTTSTVFYSTSGNIIVSSSLGRAAACPAPAVGSGDIEGFFSADQSFIAQTGANCSASPAVSDLQLNVQGSIVVRAGGVTGGFDNRRTLCTNNVNYPSFMIRERPDFILNAPDVLKTPNYIWQEVAP